MKREDWTYARRLGGLESNSVYRNQKGLERKIVRDYASRQSLSYEAAERGLAERKEILAEPTRDIEDVELIQSSDDDPATRIIQLDELMSLGEQAIIAFDRTRSYRIVFPNTVLNPAACRDWLASTWFNKQQLNVGKLRDWYLEHQKRFQLQMVRRIPCGTTLEFTFGYQNF